MKQEYRTLVRLGTPVMLAQLGVIAVSFADTAMVGAYGVDQLAAAAFVNSLFMVPIVMLIGFASGITPLVGALFGKGNSIGVGHTLRAGLQVNALLSGALVIAMGAIYFFLDCFGQPEELLPLIRDYYLIVLASVIPMAIYNCSMQTANAVNDTATPMWIVLAANALNILGNYLLIFGNWGMPELGLNGAGIATLVSRIISAGVMVGVLRYRDFWAGVADSSPVKDIRRQVWVTSWPLMVQTGMEIGLWSLGAVVCGWFGKIQLAAYQVVNVISQLGFMIFLGFATAVSIRAANFTGVGNRDGVRRITQAGLHVNLILAALASLLFIFGGKHLVGFFTSDTEVIASASALLFPLALYQFGDATQVTLANGLRGTGDVKPFLVVVLVAYLIVGMPALFTLAVGCNMGNVGVYYSFSFALITASIILLHYFRRALRRL